MRDDVGQLHRAFDLRNGWRGSARSASSPSAAGRRRRSDRAPGSPAPCRAREERRREQRLASGARDRSVASGVVVDRLAAQRVARGVVLERFRVVACVLQRLAEREMEVEAVLVREVARARAARASRRSSRGEKRKVLRLARLHQASPRPGASAMALAIGGDAFVLAADGLQRMAVAHPALGLARMILAAATS